MPSTPVHEHLVVRLRTVKLRRKIRTTRWRSLFVGLYHGSLMLIWLELKASRGFSLTKQRLLDRPSLLRKDSSHVFLLSDPLCLALERKLLIGQGNWKHLFNECLKPRKLKGTSLMKASILWLLYLMERRIKCRVDKYCIKLKDDKSCRSSETFPIFLFFNNLCYGGEMPLRRITSK